jgi:hypothetical protein
MKGEGWERLTDTGKYHIEVSCGAVFREARVANQYNQPFAELQNA